MRRVRRNKCMFLVACPLLFWNEGRTVKTGQG